MDVRDRGIQVRSEAIGMLKAGTTQKNVARELHVTIRTVKRWWSSYQNGESLETKGRSGRPQKLNRVNKIVLAKSIGKTDSQHGKLPSEFVLVVIRYLT